MSFKFNFSCEKESREPKNEKNVHIKTSEGDQQELLVCKQSKEVDIDWHNISDCIKGLSVQNLQLSDEVTLKYVNNAESRLDAESAGGEQSELYSVISSHSDLVPHVYEGGLKVWECSIDLVQYLATLNIAFRGLRVLELGCGGGLPGLYAYHQGAHVDFQDYNEEVLRLLTAVNVWMDWEAGNVSDTETAIPGAPGRCRFIAGDWAHVHSMLVKEGGADEQNRYDLILTSETIYSPESYGKLLGLMKALLKKDGKVYLAAKTCYFGVGGGTRDFEVAVDQDGAFLYSTCKHYEDGVQREILQLVQKKDGGVESLS